VNPRILLEHVPLVRRLLAGSVHPEVAKVGKLGEITYLVDEHVVAAQVQIYDMLIASLAANHPRARGIRNMQALRDVFARYVGKNLLKAGLQCESQSYEVYIDATTQTVVHLSGFVLEPPPEPPQDATPADQARWIFEHPSDGSRRDGKRIVELLLAGRDIAQLSNDELQLLARGYNWWGQNERAFEAVKVALARGPSSTGQQREWLDSARLYLRNSYLQNLPRLLTACDICITAGIGPPAFWHLMKADAYIDFATGECELEDYIWSPGQPIMHPEMLRPAADAMVAALACDPKFREQECRWSDWNTRFAAVLQDPAFAHLRSEAQ
jgi:hypothetical protein